MSDVEDRYRRLADGFDARVQAVPADGWEASSPCEEWTAGDVVIHIVDGHRQWIARLPGREAEPAAADVTPEEAWREAYGALAALTADPEAMATVVEGPMGPMPLEQVIGRFVCMDLLVHTWDLARATGGDEHLDEDAVSRAYEALKPLDAMLRQPGVFGPKLDPPAGADTQTEFLYFLGRRA